jgi:hypothetical protein
MLHELLGYTKLIRISAMTRRDDFPTGDQLVSAMSVYLFRRNQSDRSCPLSTQMVPFNLPEPYKKIRALVPAITFWF